jgi:hypothetical protein
MARNSSRNENVGAVMVMSKLPRHMRPKLSTEQEHAVIILYQQGNSIQKIVPMYGVNGQTVLNILERHGINRGERNKIPRLYNLNIYAFDAIDTEEAAYWLGFIAADRSIKREV